MEWNKMPYTSFDNYILRTPLMPVGFFSKLMAESSVDNEKLKLQFENPVVKEAVFLASPVLYREIVKWTEGKIKEDKEAEKIKLSFLKYLTRMASRPTPFGLFAGCGLGSFSDENNIRNTDYTRNKRHTRLDMNFVGALNQLFTSDANIREQLRYYPNTSLYFIGDQIRYVECLYKNGNRIHHLVEIETSDYIRDCVEKARQGISKGVLIEQLISDEITKEEATDFIDELIDNQLLVSEMELSVSGEEFIGQTLKILKKLKGVDTLVDLLEETAVKIAELDRTMGNDPEVYTELIETLRRFEIPFDEKYIFQTDMILNADRNVLAPETTLPLQKAIVFLNKITPKNDNPQLQKFTEKFRQRYEDREVPLALVLDNELGIGYPVNNYKGGMNSLLNNINLPGVGRQRPKEVRWAAIDSILYRKMQEARENKSEVIRMTDEDVKGLEASWDDLPDTFSVTTEMINGSEQQQFVIRSVGGSGAANLMGRFCLGDAGIDQHARKIIRAEEQLNPDKLVSEIIHLPENRVGNVLMRPDFRQFEIPYLGASAKPTENQLLINDLLVSVKSGKIVLRSRKHNKEILPRLTNAHNYSYNALPVYHFLCDLQTQGKRGGLYFNWGVHRDECDFLPRVEYDGIILSKAKWKITAKEMEEINTIDTVSGLPEIKKWREKRQIPDHVVLVEGDNKLLLNLENITSFRMLVSAVAKRNVFELEEFLCGDETIVSGKGSDHFANEFIFSFFKTMPK
ncbi:lantibiotic dehydratase family protein [Flavobacterium cerinum]|uniref:Lantibiotic dehydratase family protein n=1 Tax=Flavobacterium cerinum TaxID=2502784 RepID=A0ABY5IWS0_9FLAO|nr:lantibiotic dehydratase family protein [Flavobacterium cerinum]UUC47259.1 lantibiotic dehydratase family protein [Flavobacterium cerinum]